MPLIAMPPLTFGCDSAIAVRWPPADHPDTTMPLGVAAERGQLPGEIIDARWISATISSSVASGASV